MEYLTIGEFAAVNHVTKKALMLYHRMGLLVPEKVDADTGYRYYTYDQCSTLDMIVQLSRIGLSLSEIRSMMEARSLVYNQEKVRARIAELETQLQETRLALDTAKGLEEAFSSYGAFRPMPRLTLTDCPAMTLLRFPVDPYPVQKTYSEDPGLHNWERALRSIKDAMIREQIPLLHFHNIGCIVSRESLIQGIPVCTGGFIPCPPEYLDRAENVPAGPRLTAILPNTFDEEGNHMEYKHISQMLSWLKTHPYRIAGDYYAEILAETPAFFYEGRDMMLRINLPVSPIS